MKSKKATKQLEDEKQWLEEQLAACKEQTDKMWAELERAPREEIEVGTLEIVNGKHVEGTQTIVVAHTDQRRDREYYDAMRAQGHLEHRTKQIESLLSPKTGRAKGTRNRRRKPLDPTIVKAKEFSKTVEGRGLTQMKLAIRFSGCKTFSERRKWVYRYKKAQS